MHDSCCGPDHCMHQHVEVTPAPADDPTPTPAPTPTPTPTTNEPQQEGFPGEYPGPGAIQMLRDVVIAQMDDHFKDWRCPQCHRKPGCKGAEYFQQISVHLQLPFPVVLGVLAGSKIICDLIDEMPALLQSIDDIRSGHNEMHKRDPATKKLLKHQHQRIELDAVRINRMMLDGKPYLDVGTMIHFHCSCLPSIVEEDVEAILHYDGYQVEPYAAAASAPTTGGEGSSSRAPTSLSPSDAAIAAALLAETHYKTAEGFTKHFDLL